MEAIIKIEEIRLSKLNNAEYASLMRRTHKEASIATATAIGITDEDLDALEANILKMEKLTDQSHISDFTVFIEETDQKRDEILTYLLTDISNKCLSPIEQIKEAAIALNNTTKQYDGAQKDTGIRETERIKGLIHDCKKDENASKVTILGLDEIISQLEIRNNKFEEFTAERISKQKAVKVENSKTVRAANDPIYDYITTKAFAASVATPSAAASEFITELNAIIEEINTHYNQRKAAAAAKKEKEDKEKDPEKPTEQVVQ